MAARDFLIDFLAAWIVPRRRCCYCCFGLGFPALICLDRCPATSMAEISGSGRLILMRLVHNGILAFSGRLLKKSICYFIDYSEQNRLSEPLEQLLTSTTKRELRYRYLFVLTQRTDILILKSMYTTLAKYTKNQYFEIRVKTMINEEGTLFH